MNIECHVLGEKDGKNVCILGSIVVEYDLK